MKKILLLGFSLVELMVTLVVVSILTATMAPVITKRLKSKEITVSTSVNKNIEFEQDCSAFGVDCAICFDDRCALCAKVCNSDEYVDTPECTCKSCDVYEQCLECSAKQCTRCNLGYYLENSKCAICPVANSCDGTYKTACLDGYYSDVEGLGTCKTCASNVENCSICNKETGVCESCKDGYDFIDNACVASELSYTFDGTMEETTSESGLQKIILKSSGTFVAKNSKTATIFLVGGGGGAGTIGGGGGGGYTTTKSITLSTNGTYTVTIGNGGNGGVGYGVAGSNGGTTLFGSLASASGGGAGSCGGTGCTGKGGSGTGSGGQGMTGESNTTTKGGKGKLYEGSYYGGGGSACGCAASEGGGGAGGTNSTSGAAGKNGTANTGGGGGGGCWIYQDSGAHIDGIGGKGGSGIIIITVNK